MAKPKPIKIRKPRNDDRLVWNIQFAVSGDSRRFRRPQIKAVFVPGGQITIVERNLRGQKSEAAPRRGDFIGYDLIGYYTPS